METTELARAEACAEVRREAEEADIKFVRLWFTDVVGRLKSFAITRDELEGAMANGMGFDGSSVTGFNAIEESDMIAMPDPTTFRVLPVEPASARSRRMICDVRTPDGEPYMADSRHVLRGALERMRSLGFDSFKIGPELEYFYFRLDEDGRPHAAGRGRLLRGDDRRRLGRPAQADGAGARGDGHPGRVPAPRGGAEPARDRHALRRRPGHGRPLHHLPQRGQGGRQAPRRVRDLHAQAAVRRERLGDAHAPVALHRRRATRSTTPTTGGTCPTSPRASSPASCGTPARSRCSSPSG